MLTQEELDKCLSYSDVCRLMGYSLNGRGTSMARKLVEDNNLSTAHFGKKRKYERIEKICPVCGTKFITAKGSKKEKTVCSYACSNTYFRSGEDNPNWNPDTYRTTCFLYHKHECVICGEDKVVEVHHYDEDRTNNDPSNLIPLCPTHHKYWHSRYKHIVKPKIDDYLRRIQAEGFEPS